MPKFSQGPYQLRVHALLAILFISFASSYAAAQQTPPSKVASDRLAAGASLRALQADVNAALSQIEKALLVTKADPALFKLPAQAAINALVGHEDPGFSKVAASPPGLGALPDLEKLRKQAGAGPWRTMLGGVEPNLDVAVEDLKSTLTTRDFYAFQMKASRALVDLEMALGHSGASDGLAGIDGALAGTTLGLPKGTIEIDACKIPASVTAPTYGVKDGRIAFLAVPTSAGAAQMAFPAGLAAAGLQTKKGYILIQTGFGMQLASSCAGPAPPAAPVHQQGMATPRPMLYTLAQARAGKALFQSDCVTCHGANLQGVAAPSVAGTDFLTTAAHNGWSLEIIRLLVVQNMPFNNPGSLEPVQYADLLAYLLASNCYPAGKVAFPLHDDATFASIKLGPAPSNAADPKTGVCPVN